EVQGKYWSGPDAPEDSVHRDEKWKPVGSSLWDPQRLGHYTGPAPLDRSRSLNSTIIDVNSISSAKPQDLSTLFSNVLAEPEQTRFFHDIIVHWEINSLTFEDRSDPPETYSPSGYSDLRVRAVEIDQIIPPLTQDEPGNTDTGKQKPSTSTPP